MAHPENPYLQQRGYPGTHDIVLGARVLDELRSPFQGVVRIPRYDKSAHKGLGDRAPCSAWTEARTPLDILFFEGWMLGFHKVSPSPDDSALREVNASLPAYEEWTRRLDGFLHLDPLDYRYVLDWRVEAEEKMKADGKPGLSTAEARAYIEKFLPAYELWLPGLREKPPLPRNNRRVVIGQDRQLVPLTTG
jgi:D-glycerate 3-kinase